MIQSRLHGDAVSGAVHVVNLAKKESHKHGDTKLAAANLQSSDETQVMIGQDATLGICRAALQSHHRCRYLSWPLLLLDQWLVKARAN